MRIQANGYDYGRIVGAPPTQAVNQYVERYHQTSQAQLPQETLNRMEELRQAQMEMTQYTDNRLLEHIHNQTQGYQLGKLNYYSSVATLRAAEVADTRWIMAHPSLQELYQRGESEGYDEDYIHVETMMPPTMRRDYLLATHGIMNPDGSVSKYQDTMMQDCDRLDTSEKQNWCDMYGIIDEAILDGYDPASRYGNTL